MTYTAPAKPRALRATALAAIVIAMAIVPAFFSITTFCQGRQLSLADILIALRSKKAPLADRNKLLAEAINDRGTTFNLTPEIEKELTVTGADKGLISSIKKAAHKDVAIVPASDTKVVEDEEPKRLEARDTASLESRANDSLKKGDLDAAIIDYTKVIEQDASSVSSLMGRASAYFARNLYTLATADLSKAIELDPRNAAAYSLRGQIYEKRSENELAMNDFKRSLALDPANEVAKAAVDKWNAEQARVAKQDSATPAPITVPEPVTLPEFVDLGQLTEAQTVELAKPVYSRLALNARITGRVVVEVELDKEGNVTKAKTVKGHPYLRKSSEDAARDSKFKPAMFRGVAVKAKGTVVYSYVPQAVR